MKKTDRKRLALRRDAVRVLAELSTGELRQVRGGGGERTTPEAGCASSSQQSTSAVDEAP